MRIFKKNSKVPFFTRYGPSFLISILKRKEDNQYLSLDEKNHLARLELSEDIAGVGFWEYDSETKRVYWSDKVYELHGITKDTFTPSIESALSFYHPDDVDLVKRELEKSCKEKTPFSLCARIIRHDGVIRHIQSRGRPIYSEKSGTQKIVGVFQDITARKEFETEVSHHRENLENMIQSRTQELQRALAESKSAERAKSNFFANMSHELRTPLNSIIGMTQLIEMTELNDEQTEMFGYIRASSSILLKTVNDILDVSKIEAKELFLEKIPFDIFENLRGTVETLRAIISNNYLTLTHNLANLSQVVIGDPTRFTRIATNLIANAIRYTDEGYVDIQAQISLPQDETKHGRFTLTVKDTGIGIDESKIDLIFEKFTQADTSITRRFGGTGLGLAITKELVELMGGHITVASEVGKGSVFTVNIPFELASPEDLHEEEEGLLSVDEFQTSFNRISIKSARFLVAEDHDMNQLFIRKLLDNLGTKNYKIVENGELAVSEVQNNNYDILLMDCHMPILSGYDATVKIRFLNDSFAASIPIIAMTANAMPEDKALCLQTGMNAYISKPIDVGSFKNILSQWIDFEDKNHANKEEMNIEETGMTIVNLDNLISNSQGDDDFVKEMLVLFKEQAEEQIDSLEKHCIDGESKQWVEISHALKGTAGSVGAESMRLVCATAQKMPVAGASERSKMVEQIKVEYKKTLNYLKEIKMIDD